ncbi:phospholipase-like protein [Tanacetum coccineum]
MSIAGSIMWYNRDLESKVIIRSKLNYFWLIKQKLDVNRRNLFRHSCFGCWLDLLYFDHEPQLIDYVLRKQHKVDASHYDMPLIYYTEGHSLHFGRPEFALITGLPFGHVNFGLYTSGELKFRNRVFPHKLGLSVTNLDVIGVIEDEETFQKLCDQDSIRLCLILCLEVIFMGRLLTCPVDDTLFRLVESLEDWNCFPWGEHIWTHLYDQIQNVIEKHSDEHYFRMKRDRMYVPTYTLSGFVFAFQVWIFESFERCNCWWIKDPNVIPRAVGWSKKSIFNRSDCGYLFAKESTTTSDIRPTKAEYESSWWIRSQLFFRQHVPKAPVVQHHSLYETYLAKLEKSRKRGHSSFITSYLVFHTLWKQDGNPARAYIKQALGSFKDGDGDGDTHYERSHKGVKASANSDIIFFFTSAQDGNKLLDDERLSLADDLKKAHDQNQNKSK